MTPTYQQWVVPRHGGPDVLELADAPVEEPGTGQLRLRTVAAGVAFGDILHRYGPSDAPKPPYVPGYDVVGVVEAVGTGVSRFRIGQTVASLVMAGGYSQVVLCPAHASVPVPDGVDPAQAVALVLNYLTAYQMLHRVAGVQRGQQILVHGAAGGVGTALLDLAQTAGVAAIGTASAAKHTVLRDYGAQAIDRATEDFVTHVTRAGGVDAAFDPIGGAHWLRSYRCLRPGGWLVRYGASDKPASGPLPTIAATVEIKVRSAFSGQHSVMYNVVNPRSGENPNLIADLTDLLDRLARHDIRPLIAERIPFDKAPLAQEMLEARSVAGKIVLTLQA